MRKPRSKPSPTVALEKPSGLRAAGPLWQIQTAEPRFREVFRRARTEGPQLITRQREEGIVMISDVQLDRLVGRTHQPKILVQFLWESPLVGLMIAD